MSNKSNNQLSSPSPSSRVTILTKDVENNLASIIQDIEPLLKQLKNLTVDEQREFFCILFQKGWPELSAFLESLWGQDEQVDTNLIISLARWPSPQAGDLLHRLSMGTSNKKMIKAIRRALFNLKSKGLKVPEIVDQSELPIFHPPKIEPAQAYLTAYDGEGNRLLVLCKPQIPKGILIFEIVANDEKGIVDFEVLEVTKNLAKEFLDNWLQESLLPLVEVDVDYCLGLINEAQKLTQEKEKASAVAKWLPFLGPLPTLPLTPIIYQYLSKEEIKENPLLLDRTPQLMEVFPFDNWFLEQGEIQKFFDLYKETLESPLILTAHQKESRLEDIYTHAAQEIFNPRKRNLYRRRLEEMAYVLFKGGKEQEARVCLAAAIGLEKESGLLSPHPFLRELLKRSLQRLWDLEKSRAKKNNKSLLLKPNQEEF